MKVTILGCGTSSGVPRIGNDWGQCDPAEPRNARRRVSILVETACTRILVDTSPDLRMQLLDAGTAQIDAVIWTHDHADHVHGLDDLRQLYHNGGAPIAGFARPATIAVLMRRFGYVFEGADGYPATCSLAELRDEMTIGDIVVRTVDQPHGSITSAGLRFEADEHAVGYATDFHAMTAAMLTHYAGLDLWIVDALRRRPHPTHPHLAEVLGWADALSPRLTLLTHMDNSMDYRSLVAELPSGVEPGFDNQVIEF
ncbi:MBL fold metallo-hydrolase [Sphingomonas sp. ID1715]|uniref:MBL fold metallo-hydrolase n=1 Tax=Sphingomonas sp. ID1715 TaxID=1656898 RepID=UPI001488C530|nr:MBL fold metallo-hydrolase [Sphingomonas sp. ID1715]NNM75414.1 MBL fold metallo-hydrolase [Sphingomonas sp. ID1715]